MKRAFFCEKRGECGDLSVKMDSRVRGNDEVNAGIPAENKFSIFRKTGNISFPRTRRNSAKKRRHSRESGNLFGEINLGISAYFFCEKRGECGGLSVKMDSRVRGNDGGEAGICRRESDGQNCVCVDGYQRNNSGMCEMIPPTCGANEILE